MKGAVAPGCGQVERVEGLSGAHERGRGEHLLATFRMKRRSEVHAVTLTRVWCWGGISVAV